jgi:hypothetical protein
VTGPSHIFVGRIPDGAEAGDEVLIQVWADDEADIATRRTQRQSWGVPEDLEPRPTV